MWWIDMHDGGVPKRGDIVQTNVGDRRERTWMILQARHMKRAKHPHRYHVFAARWWELEQDMRIRLWRSAERNGGQRTIYFKRYPVKKRRTFEDFMERTV